MGNSEDYRAAAIAKRMLLFDYIENDKGFDAREKFLRIMCEMEIILGDMYEHSTGGMRTMRIDGDIYQIGAFDHEPVDKEHKLCSIQICYRRFNPFALILCGKRRMSLSIDDDDNVRASVIRWWPDRPGRFKYDREAFAINELFSTLIAQYGAFY